MTGEDLDALLALDGASFETAAGYVVEFKARRTASSAAKPYGVSYSLVLRRKAGGPPLVRFDNSHRAGRAKGRDRGGAHDHWHRTADDPGRAYVFRDASRLLDDFWREVKRVLDERGVPNDL